MSLDKEHERLRARAQRALGNHRVTDALVKVRAIIGASKLPPSEPLAQSALDKLHRGDVPDAAELTALEIVVRMLRPVVFSRNSRLDDLPEHPEHQLYPQEMKDLWSGFRDRVERVVRSIGRIEGVGNKHVGTGFLVSAGLLATNRHVLGALTYGSEVLPAGKARVVFGQETGLTNKPEDIVAIDGVAAVHPRLDIVLLSVRAQDRDVAPLEPAPAAEGTPVVAIGYPGEDPANNPLFLSGVFAGKFGIKRAALGEVLDGTEPPMLFHDCSTTQGNSGSPVFSLASAKVVGIHRAGFFMYRNEAVDAGGLRQFIDGAGG